MAWLTQHYVNNNKGSEIEFPAMYDSYNVTQSDGNGLWLEREFFAGGVAGLKVFTQVATRNAQGEITSLDVTLFKENMLSP